MKIAAGITMSANVMRPKMAHVPRQPTRANSTVVIIGINTFESPWPRLATAMARPRRRTNQREIVTLTTI